MLDARSEWWELRSRFKTTGVVDQSINHSLVRAWFLDDCPKLRGNQYARYTWELDAWTEYWDIYHPETKGCYYFGTADRPGYLSLFIPNPNGRRSAVFDSWKAMALSATPDAALEERFRGQVRDPRVIEAVLAVDELVRRIVRSHFISHPAR